MESKEQLGLFSIGDSLAISTAEGWYNKYCSEAYSEPHFRVWEKPTPGVSGMWLNSKLASQELCEW